MLSWFLTQLREELKQSSNGYREELIAHQDAVEDVETQTAQVTEELTNTENKVKRLEEAYSYEKESLDHSQATHEQVIDELESRLMKMRDTSAEDSRIATASRRITELQAALSYLSIHLSIYLSI